MKDSFDAFEVQLKRLKPTRPAAEFTERVESSLAAAPTGIPPRVPAWRTMLERWLGPFFSPAWSFAAAAVLVASIAAALVLTKTRSVPDSATVSASNRVGNDVVPPATGASSAVAPASGRVARAATVPDGVYDDGLVRDASGAIIQQVRYQYTDTLAWRDAQTGAEVVVSFPRVEVYSTTVRAF